MTTLTFVAPPPGLAPLVDFTLERIDGAEGLYALQSIAVPERRMFVLDPFIYMPGYTPELSDEQCARINLTRPADAFILVVTNHQDGITTANLLAPIVVNILTDCCAQFILEGQGWPLKAILAP